jgi:uncharacterized protein (DUF486 family)
MRLIYTAFLLMASNVFMTLAWYGHLKWKNFSFGSNWGLAGIILFSWGIALIEYVFMVPANRFGSRETGGPLDMFQLKILQEVISIVVFSVVVVFVFRGETLHWRYILAFCLLIAAVGLVFWK